MLLFLFRGEGDILRADEGLDDPQVAFDKRAWESPEGEMTFRSVAVPGGSCISARMLRTVRITSSKKAKVDSILGLISSARMTFG